MMYAWCTCTCRGHWDICREGGAGNDGEKSVMMFCETARIILENLHPNYCPHGPGRQTWCLGFFLVSQHIVDVLYRYLKAHMQVHT